MFESEAISLSKAAISSSLRSALSQAYFFATFVAVPEDEKKDCIVSIDLLEFVA
jgi:hypothetical protein